MLWAGIWWQVCCLLDRRGTLTHTHTHHFKIKITIHTVHIPLDNATLVCWSPWWPRRLPGTTTTTPIIASAARGHYVEHLVALSHLKPILQRFVFMKNAHFPLLARPLSAKNLEGEGGEPLALVLDALHGCTGTAKNLWSNTFIKKENCNSLGLTYLSLTLINAEHQFCFHRLQSSILQSWKDI